MRVLASALLLLIAAPAHADGRDFMLTNFERIRVDGPYDVRVVTGASASAHAEGDRAALRRLTLRIDGGTLVVTAGAESWEGWRGAAEAPPMVTVSVPHLRAALVNGSGRLSVDRMGGERVDLGVNGAGTLAVGAVEADQLFATLTGTGRMTVGGHARAATFGYYGAGSVEAGGLLANELTVRANSSGEGHFAARFMAFVTAAALGAVTVSGRPECHVAGPGPVFCGDNVIRRR